MYVLEGYDTIFANSACNNVSVINEVYFNTGCGKVVFKTNDFFSYVYNVIVVCGSIANIEGCLTFPYYCKINGVALCNNRLVRCNTFYFEANVVRRRKG